MCRWDILKQCGRDSSLFLRLTTVVPGINMRSRSELPFLSGGELSDRDSVTLVEELSREILFYNGSAVGVGHDDFEEAIGTLTKYRRKIRRPNKDNENLPVIFNDYMNCLFGDPTTEKSSRWWMRQRRPDKYFVIDAGWYADGNWWDSVGEWQEVKSAFRMSA